MKYYQPSIDKLTGALSFQLGHAFTPIAPQTVQTRKTAPSHHPKRCSRQNCVVMTPQRTASDSQRTHPVFPHVAQGHHWMALLLGRGPRRARTWQSFGVNNCLWSTVLSSFWTMKASRELIRRAVIQYMLLSEQYDC